MELEELQHQREPQPRRPARHRPARAYAVVPAVRGTPIAARGRAREPAGVVVLFPAALQLDAALDVEDPGEPAVARERSDGRDVAVPRRRRRVMSALRDDGGEARTGHRRAAKLVLDDGHRLAVFPRVVAARLGCERSASIVAARSKPDAFARRSAGVWAVGTRPVSQPARLAHEALRRATSQENVSSSRTSNMRASAPAPAAPRDPRGWSGRVRGESALPCEGSSLGIALVKPCCAAPMFASELFNIPLTHNSTAGASTCPLGNRTSRAAHSARFHRNVGR